MIHKGRLLPPHSWLLSHLPSAILYPFPVNSPVGPSLTLNFLPRTSPREKAYLAGSGRKPCRGLQTGSSSPFWWRSSEATS